MMENCILCGEEAILRCDGCATGGTMAYFCSKEHQKMHQGVDGKCFGFSIESSATLGRYLRANQAFEAGQLIFQENAQAIGPDAVSTLQCIMCCSKIMDESSENCPECGYSICKEKCLLNANSHIGSEECQVLKALKNHEHIKEAQDENSTFLLDNRVYEPVLPLRLLLDKRKTPSAFSFLLTLMDHEQDRKNDENGEYWDHSCETVINPLLYAFNEVNLEKTSFDEVAKIVGITEVNNCEIFNQDGSSGIRGLFPITSLMSHSCVPNCRVVQLQAKPNQSYCLALNPIKSGEELRISYVNLLMPTYMRRRHLAENWYFDCICERCQDVTEKGSYVGALKCSNCCDSQCYVLPVNPLDSTSIWKSTKCNCCHIDLEKVDEIVKTLLEEKNSLEKKDVTGHLDFLKKAEKSLHPNHYIIKITQRWILPMTNCQVWPDKEDALKTYLNLLNQMDLGLCKDKARLLYEKAHMEMLALLNDFNQGLLKKSDFIKVIEIELLPLFDEVKWILRYDAKTSVEGKICAAVESYMSTLRDFVVQ